MLKCIIADRVTDQMRKDFLSANKLDQLLSELMSELYILDEGNLKIIQIIKFIINICVEKESYKLPLYDLRYIKSLIEDNEDAKELKSKIESYISIEEAGLHMDTTLVYSIEDIKKRMAEIQGGRLQNPAASDGLRRLEDAIRAIIQCNEIDLNQKTLTINAVINNSEIISINTEYSLDKQRAIDKLIGYILEIEEAHGRGYIKGNFNIPKLIEVLKQKQHPDPKHPDVVSYFTDDKPMFGGNMIDIIGLYKRIMYSQCDYEYLAKQSIIKYLLKVDITLIKEDIIKQDSPNIRLPLPTLSLQLFTENEISNQIISIIQQILDCYKAKRRDIRFPKDLFVIKQCLAKKRSDAVELIAEIDVQIKTYMREVGIKETTFIPSNQNAGIESMELEGNDMANPTLERKRESETSPASHTTTTPTAPHKTTRYLTLAICLCVFALFVFILWYYWATVLFLVS